ncbi:16S rRNA (uracil(1498)-N(3))-methyltransferase [Candidatus Leptofilum sp.]|uniref:16S rRNA (uracil(1498)-N(3))-methyltransferase n=1 Tax=Candidatus Leptofilum sp. TaxID=3241576 RepID=UPI003B5B08DF
MHRFFVDPQHFVGERVILPPNIAHQIRNVLRLRPGTAILVLDNSGAEYEVLLRLVDRQQVVGEAIAKRPSPNEPSVQLTLYQALMKRDKFEWVLQKGTEIGVSHFIPIVTRRSLVQEIDIKASKQARWRKILTEAAEQSRRGCIPELHPPQTLAQALAHHPNQPGFIAWEEEESLSLREALMDVKRPSHISLFIGPEGGFAPEEVEAVQAAGIQAISLGKRILRAETAALVASALILYQLEEV